MVNVHFAHLLVHHLFGFLVLFIVGLEIFAVLDGHVGLEQEVSDAFLVLEVERFEADDVVVVDDLFDLAVKSAVVVGRVAVVFIDSEVGEEMVDFLLIGDEVALGQHCYRRQLQSDLNGEGLQEPGEKLGLILYEVDVHHVHGNQRKTCISPSLP